MVGRAIIECFWCGRKRGKVCEILCRSEGVSWWGSWKRTAGCCHGEVWFGITEDCTVEDKSLLVHRRWADRGACGSHFPSLLTPACSHACLTLVRKAPKFNHPVVNLLFAHPLLFPLARRQEDSRGENRGQGRGPRFSPFLFQCVCVCVCARARARLFVYPCLFLLNPFPLSLAFFLPISP